SKTEAEEQLGPDTSTYFQDLEGVSDSQVFPDIPANFKMEDMPGPIKVYGMKSNFDLLDESATHFGFFDNDADQDSINRWVTMVQSYEGTLMPSLSLKSAALALDLDQIVVIF